MIDNVHSLAESDIVALAEECGYSPIIASTTDVLNSIKSLPAAWVTPIKLLEIDGRNSGFLRHQVTLTLLDQALYLSPEQRHKRWSQMREDLISIFIELSSLEHVVSVEKLAISPSVKCLTKHGDMAQIAVAEVICYF